VPIYQAGDEFEIGLVLFGKSVSFVPYFIYTFDQMGRMGPGKCDLFCLSRLLWLTDWAKQHNFKTKQDKVGNLAINVPGSPGYENSPPVVLQGHMDMVCEKTPDSAHDFTKDPIKLVFDGDWLKADKTTLGADNGIAIAMAMTAALAKDIAHPPLELLFTVDEETGLTGTNALKPGFIEGKIIGDKNPGMDMISIGPDLKNPHSPDEKIKIPAIGKVWDFLVELLKEL